MSVYNPTGSGNVHTDQSISGGKKVATKKTPVRKAAGKTDKATGANVGKISKGGTSKATGAKVKKGND
jgi:hypothetical protein